MYAVKDEHILLIDHKIHGWVPPGGHIEPNERPEEAVIRETYEELGWYEGKDYTFPAPFLPAGDRGLFTFEQHDAGPKGWHMNFVYVLHARTTDVAPCDEFKEHAWFTTYSLPKNMPRNVLRLALRILV